jgi:hypothetical protein
MPSKVVLRVGLGLQRDAERRRVKPLGHDPQGKWVMEDDEAHQASRARDAQWRLRSRSSPHRVQE